jgi:hypothetical protein
MRHFLLPNTSELYQRFEGSPRKGQIAFFTQEKRPAMQNVILSATLRLPGLLPPLIRERFAF